MLLRKLKVNILRASSSNLLIDYSRTKRRQSDVEERRLRHDASVHKLIINAKDAAEAALLNALQEVEPSSIEAIGICFSVCCLS